MYDQPKELFKDSPLTFDKGVACTDVITLRAAAQAIAQYLPSHRVLLPDVARDEIPMFFEDLTHISVNPLIPKVTAVIDTKKMAWNVPSEPTKTTFTDYTGEERQGVHFPVTSMEDIDDTYVMNLGVKLFDDRRALLWFAELSDESELEGMRTYDLFKLAKILMRDYANKEESILRRPTIPAQQIDYERSLDEIIAINPQLKAIVQKAQIAIDYTGARVSVLTMMLGGKSPKPEEIKDIVFGARGPVLFWLTEDTLLNTFKEGKVVPADITPFAVVATTAEAWLDPNRSVEFDY